MTLAKGQNGRNPAPDPVAPVYGRLFRVRGAAQYLGLKESRARTLIARGELVAVRNARGRLEGVYEHDCDAWLATHRAAATPATPRPSIDDRIAQLPGAGHFA